MPSNCIFCIYKTDLTAYIPLVTLVVTVASSYIILSRQIKKTKRSEWIEKFRSDMAKFMALTMSTSYNTTNEELKEILKVCYSILLLINPVNKKQMELQSHVASLTMLLSQALEKDHIEQFKSKHNAIVNLAREIILEETKRI